MADLLQTATCAPDEQGSVPPSEVIDLGNLRALTGAVRQVRDDLDEAFPMQLTVDELLAGDAVHRTRGALIRRAGLHLAAAVVALNHAVDRSETDEPYEPLVDALQLSPIYAARDPS